MILNENTYKGYELNETKKANKGFYTKILDEILNQINYCLSTMTKPVAVHLIIDNPKQNNRLDKFLSKFVSKRQNVNGSKLKLIHYLAVNEIRPRNKNHHLHLMLILDSGTYKDCIALEELSQSLSLTKQSKLQQRRFSNRPLKTNPETGEIYTNKNGDDFLRIGSSYYHDIRMELNDTIKRFSYLAKVFSKTDAAYTATRLKRPKPNSTTIDEISN